MTSGIFLEIPLGRYYDKKVCYSIRKNVKKIFGFDARSLENEVIDDYIINGEEGNVSKHPGIYRIIAKKFGRLLASLPYDDASGKSVVRGFMNRSGDLIRSFCFGVYRDGELRRMYRFTGGKLDGWEPTEMEYAIGMKNADVYRLEKVSIEHGYHPDPAERAQSFLQQYRLLSGHTGFTVVFAVTMPYAVMLERTGDVKRYSIQVMEGIKAQLVNMTSSLRTSKKDYHYGYVIGQ
ncbi:MAG: hypothetical protein J6X31_09600 [Bacteroidales bacterium]|nr:hypothetical protein [Bacteroidales bacterium]